MNIPVCIFCNVKFEKLEHLNNHLTNMHKESSCKRLDRLTLTIESSVNSKKNIKDFSCSECGEYFGNSDEQNYHIGILYWKQRRREEVEQTN